MAIDVASYLAEQQRKSTDAGQSDLAQQWMNLEQLYNKKLWHQLTIAVGAFVKAPEMQNEAALVQFYKQFIADFEHRVNCLALVEIVLHIISHISQPKEALEFLSKVKNLVKSSDEASVLCLTAIGKINLKNKEYDDCKKIIKEAQELLDTLDEVTSVHGRFYELSSYYHMLMGNHADYYRDALRFLGCMDLNDIPTAERADRAFNLGLAAVLGKGVYNFGELLAHPILDSLKGTAREWLINLLYAFNAGDIAKFDELKPKWRTQADLAAQEKHLREKISLLCLMEQTFKRPATDRRLTFADIGKEARVGVGEVEHLVMKALSLNLVRGSIDEVDQCVNMTWVQPRVLDTTQIANMNTQMKAWATKVLDMEKLVDDRAHDILT